VCVCVISGSRMLSHAKASLACAAKELKLQQTRVNSDVKVSTSMAIGVNVYSKLIGKQD